MIYDLFAVYTYNAQTEPSTPIQLSISIIATVVKYDNDETFEWIKFNKSVDVNNITFLLWKEKYEKSIHLLDSI